jgi:RNA polymerase sigma-70 factor (ECF subfamily)
MLEEDSRLIRELKQGSKEALRRVYEMHKDKLLTIAVSMVHDTATAEDILHDVFVSFASSVRRLNIKISLRRYLITSVVNRIRDTYRKKRPRMVDLDNVELADTHDDGPVGGAVSNETANILTDALAQIPDEQREVIVLHLNGGLKFKEIAEMRGTSTSTIQGRYRYGLEKLRTIVDGEMIR